MIGKGLKIDICRKKYWKYLIETILENLENLIILMQIACGLEIAPFVCITKIPFP